MSTAFQPEPPTSSAGGVYNPTAREALDQLDSVGFSNRAFEDEARRRVEKAVQKDVRAFESRKVQAANDDVAATRALTRELYEQAEALDALRKQAEGGIDADSADLLEQWRRVESRVGLLLTKAEAVPNRAAQQIAALEDPLASLSAFQDRWPVLQRKIYG